MSKFNTLKTWAKSLSPSDIDWTKKVDNCQARFEVERLVNDNLVAMGAKCIKRRNKNII